MKKLIIILAVLVSGCMYRVNSWQVDQAVKFCGSLDKIDHMMITSTNDDSVTCRDGNVKYLRAQAT